MNSSRFHALSTFISAARDTSQSEIIKEFLQTIVFGIKCSESGAIHVYDATKDTLKLFNEDDFLFKMGFLDRAREWPHQLNPREGKAGEAFRTCRIVRYRKASGHDANLWCTQRSAPITDMVCAPIMLSRADPPFGVASFHNETEGKEFSEEDIEVIETYVSSLGLALEASRVKLERDKGKEIFIVHGRDMNPVKALDSLLRDNHVEALTLSKIPRAGGEILQVLEETVERCNAAFVILTPDDEGRLKRGKSPLVARARENVIFESGLLTARLRKQKRICFLKKNPVVLPSDIGGLFVEEFTDINDIRDRIVEILRGWNMVSSSPSAPAPARRPMPT